MKVLRHALKPMLAAHIMLASPCLALPPQFGTSYEQAIQQITVGFPGKEDLYLDRFIETEFQRLLTMASREELGQAIAATLASPEKRGFWLAAHSLAGMLGPGFDRSQIVAAVRENLPRYLVLDDARIKSGQAHKLIHVAAHVLCYHGTEADVARIASFASEVARFNPSLAATLQSIIRNRDDVLKSQKAASSRTTDRQDPQPAASLQQGSEPRPAQHSWLSPHHGESMKAPSPPPWSVLLFSGAVLMLGGLWLRWRKKNKPGAN